MNAYDLSNFPAVMVIATVAGLFVGLQLFLTVAMFLALRMAGKERVQLNKEMFGLLRKIEGLTSTRREQMLKHYDSLLETLSTQLPPAVASQLSQVVFDTESKILARLADLQPGLKSNAAAKEKMDELIKSMESLEKSVVVMASDTVKKVMVEGRRSLLDDERFSDVSQAN